MEDEDEDEDEDEVANKEGSKVEIEVLVKREGDESYSMVPWRLSNTYHVPRTYEPRAYIYLTGVLVPLAARRQLADRLDEHRLSPRECAVNLARAVAHTDCTRCRAQYRLTPSVSRVLDVSGRFIPQNFQRTRIPP